MYFMVMYSSNACPFAGLSRKSPSWHGLYSCLGLVLCCCIFFCSPGLVFAASTGDDGTVKGRASWYGLTAHGKQTANGEIFNHNALTAAHKDLPFGTVISVRNLKNGKNILVRINDRGPFVQDRVVDVSRRAATALNMVVSGVVPVTIKTVGNTKGEPLNKGNAFFVNIDNAAGVFSTRERMAMLGRKLKIPLRAMPREHDGKLYFAICSVPFSTFQEAQHAFLALERKNLTPRGIIEGPVFKNPLAKLFFEAQS